MKGRFFLRIIIVIPLLHAFISHALTDDALKIRIEGVNYSDETVIRFIPGASVYFDGCCDALKIFMPNTAMPNLFTKTEDGQALSANSLPPLYGSNKVDVFACIAVSATYSFIVAEVGSNLLNIGISMKDNATGSIYELRAGSAHAVNLPVISINDSARFSIYFAVRPALPEGMKPTVSKTNGRPTVNVSSNGAEIELVKDTVSKLIFFSGHYNSGKVYLKWNITNQHTDGVYILYRSYDGIGYEYIGYKKGIGSPISNAIAYYFTDEDPSEQNVFYKLLHIGKNNTYMMSDRIMVLSKTDFMQTARSR